MLFDDQWFVFNCLFLVRGAFLFLFVCFLGFVCVCMCVCVCVLRLGLTIWNLLMFLPVTDLLCLPSLGIKGVCITHGLWLFLIFIFMKSFIFLLGMC